MACASNGMLFVIKKLLTVITILNVLKMANETETSKHFFSENIVIFEPLFDEIKKIYVITYLTIIRFFFIL